MAPHPPVYLVTGPEELLLRRRADALLADFADGEELELLDVRAPELAGVGLPDLRTGSLFGGRRAVVVREAQQLPAEVGDALVAELERSAEGAPSETLVVLLATGTGRIQRLARRAAKAGARIDVAPPKPWQEREWSALVAEELARHDREAEADALAALLDHAGLDVATIVEKVAQVAAGAPAGPITAAHVEELVVGHGNRGAFAVADALCERRVADALRLLRGALDAGEEPVMILGALAYRLRSVAAVAAGIEPADAGLRLSAGQVRRLQRLRREFGAGQLTEAYRELAAADAEIKRGELPPAFALERAVAAIAER